MPSDFLLENTGFDVGMPLWHTSGYSFVNDLRFRKSLEVIVVCILRGYLGAVKVKSNYLSIFNIF